MLALTCMLTLAAPPSFNEDVLPILSNNCFACHGPDAAAREAGLRLDTRDGAIADGAIVPGDPDASGLLHRVTDDSAKRRMPPAHTGKQLSTEEIDILRRWISDGAPWEGHWAYVPPTAVHPPGGDAWCRTPIDAFVKVRLDEHGMAPNQDADRHTLIRRVTLDLTGLPPTPDEVIAFVHDDRPDAWDHLVDRLLASPQYGEHAAGPWLDLARYADSQGFEKDNLRTMWRYRDWVINACNADMPFDQFTREQLAGDLLPNATVDQRIATGFHRNTQTNTEGGTDDEEFRSAAVIDRVNTTMQGWMGITAGCAQCHDHKYDALSQQEYFELYAFFNQTKDSDQVDDRPFISAPTEDQEAALASIDMQRAALDARLGSPDAQLQASLDAWLASRCPPDAWTVHHPLAAAAINGTLYRTLGDGTVEAHGPVPSTERTTVQVRTDLPFITGLRLTVLSDGTALGRNGNTNVVVNDVRIATSATDDPVTFDRAEAHFSQHEFDVSEAIDDDDTAHSGWALAPAFDRDHSAVFVLAEPLPVPADGLVTVELSQQWDRHGLHRFQLAFTDHDGPALPLSGDMHHAASTSASERTPDQWQALARAAFATAPQLQSLRAEDAALQVSRDSIVAQIPTALVMEALPHDHHRTTHLFQGGTFLAPDVDRGPLQPSTPGVLHPLHHDDSKAATRLDLAAWLTDTNNPLTARVQVNRVWARLFGHGLVSTEDDFGVQGERPSHPELLDWLAHHWQHDLHWSPKALMKLLVTSSVYRQSAHVDDHDLQHDPDNRLLSRAPRIRLSAEQLRDTALACGGLLKTDRIGGPSVVPRLPEGMLPQAFTSFVPAQSTGDDLYRRGLYTQWRRTGHYPTFATFDAPSREVCLVARERSNTPLQALAMLNDDVFVEAAQGLARRAMADTQYPIRTAFEIALARTPTDEEHAVLQQIHDATLDRTDIDGTLATVPLGPLPEGMDPARAVAMTVTCNVILNLDEFVNRP